MRESTITLEYENDAFEYSIEELQECSNCGYVQTTETPPQEPCPECKNDADSTKLYRYHFYIKMAWWFQDPEPSLSQHTEALRRTAKKLEALEANGWVLTDSDGEHVFFEYQADDQAFDTGPYNVTD